MSDPLAPWKGHLRRTYGITSDQYFELLDRQDGCCALCGKHYSELPKRLAVDHDHVTGEIRGLLCSMPCNHKILGRHRDSALLLRMAEYVDRHTGWFVPPKEKKKWKPKRKPKSPPSVRTI